MRYKSVRTGRDARQSFVIVLAAVVNKGIARLPSCKPRGLYGSARQSVYMPELLVSTTAAHWPSHRVLLTPCPVPMNTIILA